MLPKLARNVPTSRRNDLRRYDHNNQFYGEIEMHKIIVVTVADDGDPPTKVRTGRVVLTWTDGDAICARVRGDGLGRLNLLFLEKALTAFDELELRGRSY